MVLQNGRYCERSQWASGVASLGGAAPTPTASARSTCCTPIFLDADITCAGRLRSVVRRQSCQVEGLKGLHRFPFCQGL